MIKKTIVLNWQEACSMSTKNYCVELGTRSAVCALTLHLEVLAVCLIA